MGGHSLFLPSYRSAPLAGRAPYPWVWKGALPGVSTIRMAARNDGEGRCPGKSVKDSQVRPSLPWITHVAGESSRFVGG